MRKFKIFPAPHVEIRLRISDEMIKDYRECSELAAVVGKGKDCNTCSWHDVRINDNIVCDMKELESLLEVKK